MRYLIFERLSCNVYNDRFFLSYFLQTDTRCRTTDLKIINGKVDIVPYNKFGAMAKYTCADGYVLYGTH